MSDITEAQAMTLARTKDLRDRCGADGMFVSGPGHASHMRSLERRGWMRFVGYGHDIDCIRDGDVPIYEITPEGEAALAEWDAACLAASRALTTDTTATEGE